MPDEPAPMTQAVGSWRGAGAMGAAYAQELAAVDHPARTLGEMPLDPTHTAVGTWSGGRFMRFGEALADERYLPLIRPDASIQTVLTADTYGAGEADELLGRALEGLPRSEYCLVGAVGHDFYEGEREGAKGYPRFTDPRLRGAGEYADYLRMAAERSLERIGADAFDLLLLHNPDRTGYTSAAVWDGMAALRDAGLTRLLGIAPGPANGFTLDLIECFERFGDRIDWAMVILNPMEPWPGELVLPAAHSHGIDVITRVVDYGGLFHDDVVPGHEFAQHDHRSFRPDGWIDRGRERLELMRPIADRHALTLLQLACQWNLAHQPVKTVVPTLIQEPGTTARAIEEKRAEVADLPVEILLSEEEVAELRTIGDNSGSMALKGGTPDHEGEQRPDRWSMDDELAQVAARWSIDPERDLRKVPEPVR
jgi:aryl-alcohol dehydrogenase-like predicted oxidoreductase